MKVRHMKIVICLNTAWNLINFRAGLIRALVAAGHDVLAVAPEDKYAAGLRSLGCRYLAFSMDSKSTNPLTDILLMLRFVRLFARERPDVYLGYTIKPNIYGSLAAQFVDVPIIINNIAGLGGVFIRGGWLVLVARFLYRVALRRSTKVFFQNHDDRRVFVNVGLVRAEVAELLPGSGIDLNRFTPVLKGIGNRINPSFRFLLIARLRRDKGILEFVEAARILRKRWPCVEFALLGFMDLKDPSSITRSELDLWAAEGVTNYLGESDDVRVQLSMTDCVVLPSYREGTSRALLEAAAMALPIITTDVAGCREVVDDGVNGYLCKVKDVKDLVAKMEKILLLSVTDRSEMGLRGRRKVEAEFDEEIVIEKYLSAIDEVSFARINAFDNSRNY
jgi:glycosyltransferase involved in cell wall biosynthesis